MAAWFANSPDAAAILALATAGALGLALGSLNAGGFRLGVAGVLFAGLLLGHFGWSPASELLGFSRDFGLVLFVYAIGTQVGPGFVNSLRREGAPLNAMAAGIVITGALMTVGLVKLAGVDPVAAVGIFCGATTNTPALGAAQQALFEVPSVAPERRVLAGLGYAMAYPFGVAGIILSMVALRAWFRVDAAAEERALLAEREVADPVERRNVVVENTNLVGRRIAEIPGLDALGVAVSRMRCAADVEVRQATRETELHRGDVVLAVGTRKALDEFQMIVGRAADEDLMQARGRVTFRRLVVTRREVLGKTIRELGLEQSHGVVVTRLSRGEVEVTAVPNLQLEFGDLIQVVGEADEIARAGALVGDSVRELAQTRFIPLFLGVSVGVVLGMMPIDVPGLPAPVRLGLAAGPLLAAIVLSRIGRIGPLIWFIPGSANLALRELGLMMFLAAVGLKAGPQFMETFVSGGWMWVGWGALVTVVPLLGAGWLARVFWGQNFMRTCGVLAGSTTDPPALAFANGMGTSDSPSVAYAAVYPLSMILRILAAQILVLLLCQ